MNTEGYVSEDFVSTETAKLLLEKGCPDFGYSCIYDDEDNKLQTQAIIMKWLREVHNQNIIFDMLPKGNGCYVLWTFNIISNKNHKIIWGTKQPKYKTYEEACESAIKYCLENFL